MHEALFSLSPLDSRVNAPYEWCIAKLHVQRGFNSEPYVSYAFETRKNQFHSAVSPFHLVQCIHTHTHTLTQSMLNGLKFYQVIS